MQIFREERSMVGEALIERTEQADRSGRSALGRPEQRQFNVHPGIIKHLIREQAGTLVKAVAELVMNSVDAGASRIDLHFRKDGTFTVQDNGRGFRDRDEIERFFETFGTPHVKGDAQFGRFRIGRGQIMAFANTIWRSGNFTMDVRLLSDDAPLGYSLTETEEVHPGCLIEGVIAERSVRDQLVDVGLVKYEWGPYSSYANTFSKAIRYVDVPVYLGGELINTPPSACTWSAEDEFGYYLFDDSPELSVYNLGVYVDSARRREIGVGGAFISKMPIKLNMARNAWLEHECEVIKHLKSVCARTFRREVAESSRMDEASLGALVYKVARYGESIDEDEAEVLFDKRFILDLTGKHLSPREFLSKLAFSLYDGKSSLIAERAVAEGKIAMLVPRMFHLAELECTDRVAVEFMHTLARVFGKFTQGWNIRYVSFETIKASYSGLVKRVADSDLTPEQLAALKALRFVAKELARLTGDKVSRTRKIIAGESDCAQGWTNGFDYIAINVKALDAAYRGDAAGLVSLATHEFCHQNVSSLEEHEHGLEFYKRYHDATRSKTYGEIVRKCHYKLMYLVMKSERDISYPDRVHVIGMKRMLHLSDKVKPLVEKERLRRLRMPQEPTPPNAFDDWVEDPF